MSIDPFNILAKFLKEVNSLRVIACLKHDKELIKSVDKLQEPNCITQVLPPSVITSELHLKISAYYTFKSFDTGRNVSRKPYIEFLLYLLGTRQVGKVLNTLSKLIEGSKQVIVVRICKGEIKDIKLENCLRCDLSDVISKYLNLDLVRRLYNLKDKSLSLHKVSKEVLMKTIEYYLSL